MNNTRWPKETENKLRELWESKLSAAQIGLVLGFGRCAVLGKAHRLKLAPRRNPGNRGPRKIREPRQPRTPRVKSVTTLHTQFSKSLAQKPILPFYVVDCAPPLMIRVMQLNSRTCRFPVGDPQSSDFGFCGHPPLSGKPYCEGHCALAYQPADERRSRGYVNYMVRHAA